MMRRNPIWAVALAMLFGTTLAAQNIAGNWQGMLKAGPQELRLVLAIDKSAEGEWNATFSSIDQSPDWGARSEAQFAFPPR
jgi:hypothetical protein